jgi:hypothetical protein
MAGEACILWRGWDENIKIDGDWFPANVEWKRSGSGGLACFCFSRLCYFRVRRDATNAGKPTSQVSEAPGIIYFVVSYFCGRRLPGSIRIVERLLPPVVCRKARSFSLCRAGFVAHFPFCPSSFAFQILPVVSPILKTILSRATAKPTALVSSIRMEKRAL